MLESDGPVSKEKPLPAQLGEIIGGYELSRVLSHGGMGCVYHAVHARLGRPAAVKVLAAALAFDEELVARFFREARIVNELQHPNIVDIFDFVELENPRRLACIMEYIEGPTLKQVVRNKRFSVPQAVNATRQLTSALRVVHSINVIHRDLKPTNIIVTGNLRSDLSQVPSVKMLDFGIAKVEDAPGEHKTASGTMLGTPAYMAPEQVAGDSISTAADIYALGEIVYEMVSGMRAFPGSRAEVLKVKMSGSLPELPLPKRIAAADAIRALVSKCIAHDPNDRPTLDQFEAEVQLIGHQAVEDPEMIEEETVTDVHDIPTRPFVLPQVEPATMVEAVERLDLIEEVVEAIEAGEATKPNEIPDGIAQLREVSSFDEAPPTQTSPMAQMGRRRSGIWIAGAAVAAIALIAVLMGGRSGDPKPAGIASGAANGVLTDRAHDALANAGASRANEDALAKSSKDGASKGASKDASNDARMTASKDGASKDARSDGAPKDAKPSKAKEERRAIALSSRPSATVIDARTEARLGRTPLTLELKKGTTRNLLLVAPGRRSHPLTIDGSSDRVAVELEKVKTKRDKRKADEPPPSPPPAKQKSVQMPDW